MPSCNYAPRRPFERIQQHLRRRPIRRITAHVRKDDVSFAIQYEIAAQLEQIGTFRRSSRQPTAKHQFDVVSNHRGSQKVGPLRSPQCERLICLAIRIRHNRKRLRQLREKRLHQRRRHETDDEHCGTKLLNCRHPLLHLAEMRATRYSTEMPQEDQQQRLATKVAERRWRAVRV